MTTNITSLDNIPQVSDSLKSVSECGAKRKSVEMPPAMPGTVLRRPSNTTERDTASHKHKRPKFDILEGNDKVSWHVTGDKTKAQNSPTIPPIGKPKTYMLPPMPNLEDEKRRRNAIIAHNNRVIKKRQSQDLQEKVKTLEDTNIRLHGINQQLEKDLRTSYEQQSIMNNMRKELESEMLTLQSLFQAQQEKQAFIWEHLHLINGTIDENDTTRKLLTALLERIPFSSISLASSPHHVTSPPRKISSSYITSPPRNISPRLTTSSPPHVTLPPLAPIPTSSTAS